MKSKVFSAVLSVVLAFGLWLYVVNVISPESEKTYYDIPVILLNEDILAERGLMLTGDTPKVTLQLKGNRTDLNDLNEANINVIANVATITAPGTHNLRYDVTFPGNMTVTEQNRNPSRVTLKVESRLKKNVPVVIDYQGTTVPEGFIADTDNAILDYTTIEVIGPESVVGPIHQAVIQVSLDKQESTIVEQCTYTLCDMDGNPLDVEMTTTNVEKVNVTVKIQRLKEINLTVSVKNGGGATKNTCSIAIDPPAIRVSGSDQILEGLNSVELGTINLADLLTDTSLTFPVVLPEGVTNETGITEATVYVKFPDLMTKDFSVTTIVPINVPEGLEVDMITKALEVKVRGPSNLVSAMKGTDISVTVDFNGKQVGTETMKANVIIASAYSEVGVLGTYSVSATLQEPQEADAKAQADTQP